MWARARISERSEVIEVPKTSRQERVEGVKSVPQERISERNGQTEPSRRSAQDLVLEKVASISCTDGQTDPRRQALSERRDACPQWKTHEILVKKALSLASWESELYAAMSTGVEALRLQSGLRDFGNHTRVTIACDNQWVVDHRAH